MKHCGRWLILALPWCGLELSGASLCWALSAVALWFLEGDVVRLTKEAPGLSRMETLEQAISPVSKPTGTVQSDLRFQRACR